MKQITAQQFKKFVENDPTWASHLTEPIKITGYCDMLGSKISHLSPFLHFTGRNMDDSTGVVTGRGLVKGKCADFWACENLKTAEGTFDGFVEFGHSGVEKIGQLTITQSTTENNSVSFRSCENLKIAEGTFPGFADFENSAIEKIKDLIITQPNNYGSAASFYNCIYLKIAEGNFHGAVDFSASGIERIGKLSITPMEKSANFSDCKKLTLSKTWLERTDIDGDIRKRSELKIQNEAAAHKAMKQPTFEL